MDFAQIFCLQFKWFLVLYTVYLRGLENGEETIRKRIVTSVSGTAAAHKNYSEYAKLAQLDSLRFHKHTR